MCSHLDLFLGRQCDFTYGDRLLRLQSSNSSDGSVSGQFVDFRSVSGGVSDGCVALDQS